MNLSHYKKYLKTQAVGPTVHMLLLSALQHHRHLQINMVVFNDLFLFSSLKEPIIREEE